MKIALAIDEPLDRVTDYISASAAIVLELIDRQITHQETRRIPAGIDADPGALAAELTDCAVLFAAAFDHDSLHAITDRKIRPLVVSDVTLPVDEIIAHLAKETLRVRAPVLCNEDHEH